VLRQGRVAAQRMAGDVGRDELALLMIGELLPPSAETGRRPAGGRVALEIEDLVVEADGRRVIDHLSLAVTAGEIFGIAGVDGNGQAELVEVMARVRRPLSGRIRILGESAGNGRDGAMAVIPENRDLDGLVLDMPLWENLLLARPLLSRVGGPMGWLHAGRAVALCSEVLEQFRIRATGPGARAADLSGGNRQRLCVARALAGAPQILVAHNVTRGLDLAATAEVHRALNGFAASGGSVLLIASDLDELLSSCDRLAVISRGRLRQLGADEREPSKLGLLMAGAW
jgi:simple sugar transport system ATP-binding protein